MNSHLTDQQLNAYLHQTLNDAERETLDAHLTSCPACRARFNEWDVLQQRVRRELAAELRAVNVPLSLTFERIAPGLRPPTRVTRLWHYSRQALFGVTAVAALLIVMLVLARTSAPTANPTGHPLISNSNRVGNWMIDSDDPTSYEFGIDQSVSHTGQASGFIRSSVDAPKGSGALRQQTAADSYRGKRIRLSGYIKTEGVERDAGVWLRVDQSQFRTLSFAGMNDRSIQGTTDWKMYDQVLDVPNEATSISFAFYLMGRGQIWVDDVQLEIVGQEVATTETKEAPPLAQPTNLDFEAGLDGWLPDRNPQNYTMSIDTVNVHSGQASAHIQSKQANPISYAVLAQSVKAEAYRGKRLRLTAYVKIEPAGATAQLVAGTFSSQDIKEEDIKKTIDSTPGWEKQSLVFDVPALISDHIVLGITFQGEGQIWLDDVQVEVVGTDVPLTQPEQTADSVVQPSKPLGQDLDQSFSDWSLTGSRPQDYEVGFDNQVVHTGKSSAYVKSIAPTAPGFGTFATAISAGNYRGKRVRLAGYVKADRVEDWAGLWLRVDGPNSTTLRFDNMLNRPIQGTRDWQEYDVVLDVPENSTLIAYGLLLSGKGQVWLDNVQLQEVDQSVPTTDYESKPPTDLGFEIEDHSWAAPQENATPAPIGTREVGVPLARFGKVATLTDAQWKPKELTPDGSVELALQWTISPTDLALTSFVHVLDVQGDQVVAQSDQPLSGSGVQTVTLHLPATLTPGTYIIEAGIYNSTTFERLSMNDGATTSVIGTFQINQSPVQFGHAITLTETSLIAINPAPKATLGLSLHWTMSVTNSTPLNAFAQVLDAQGNLVTQSDQLLPETASSDQSIMLQLPETLTAGTYQIVIGVYDPATGSRLTTDSGETQMLLTTFQVESK